MCGRFTRAYTWAHVIEFLNMFGAPLNLRPRYNGNGRASSLTGAGPRLNLSTMARRARSSELELCGDCARLD
jgi:hypothetical protein